MGIPRPARDVPILDVKNRSGVWADDASWPNGPELGVVGVIAFVIDYGLLALLTEAFGVNYLVSATISFTASVVFNYVASMRYVFTHKEGMSRRREFIIFVVLSVIGLIINNACMWAGVELLHIHYLITKIGATAIVMVWNFVTRKIFLDAGDEGK